MTKTKNCMIGVIYILTACTSHTPTPETLPPSSPPTTPERESPTLESNGPWRFTAFGKAYRYRSQSFTTIHENPTHKPRVDTVRLDTYFTIGLNTLASAMTIVGHIDSLTINASAKLSIGQDKIKLPVVFNGKLTDHVLMLEPSDSQTQCASPAAAILGDIRSVILFHPSPLFLTSTWKDSLSTATCSSTQIPTVVESVSSYQVTGKTIHRLSYALVIQRTDSTRFIGHGIQGQHQVEIAGAGVSLSNIYLDISSGTITLVDTHGKADITIRVSGQERRFTQQLTQRVDLIP
jgi:hypothetical protein